MIVCSFNQPTSLRYCKLTIPKAGKTTTNTLSKTIATETSKFKLAADLAVSAWGRMIAAPPTQDKTTRPSLLPELPSLKLLQRSTSLTHSMSFILCLHFTEFNG
jgi:hypothetical protein